MDQEGKRATRLLTAGPGGIAEAAAILRAGGLVAFPTETVYGLGALAADPRAVAGIYRAKGRPSFNPLIAHVADVAGARREGRFDSRAEKLAAAFWPGPLTLVLPLADGASVCDLARAGLDSIGLRVPANAQARSLIAAAGGPVAAPSANRSGHVSPATPAHVLADLDGRIDAVLNGGACPVGVESTIVSLLDETPRLLRPGGVSRAAIEAVLGRKPGGRRRGGRRAAGAGPARLALCAARRRAARRRGRAGGRGGARFRRADSPALPAGFSIFRRAATLPRPRPICFPCCARSTPARRGESRSRPFPTKISARRSTTACAAPPRRAPEAADLALGRGFEPFWRP